MNILMWAGIVYGVLALAGIGILLYDMYRYPVCPLCGNNLGIRRVKGKIICQIHGEVLKEKKGD